MVIEYIRYTIPDAQRAEFEAAYARAAESLRRSTHCLGYELAHGVEEPQQYILRIEWDSREGHEQGFRSSAEFRSFLAEIRSYIGNIEEMKHYEATTVSSSTQH
jgi:heme-degrading monooxygenase HmoA